MSQPIFSELNITALSVLVLPGIMACMFLCMELGRLLKMRLLKQDPATARSGLGAVEGAVFSLVALLIAFTFSGAAGRFDERRKSIVEEANAIGTVWLRLDLLPAAAQPPLREKLRQYTGTRVAFDQALPNLAAADAEFTKSTVIQTEIWNEVMADCREAASSSTTMLLLPALNDMFDISSNRVMEARTHTPLLIYGSLLVLVMGGALLVGYGMGGGRMHNWLHSFAFVVTITLAMYLILDFEFPSIGLIHLGPFDQVLVNLQQSMNR